MTTNTTDHTETQRPDDVRLNVLTINTHKGFTAFNRRFILPELREAVRSTDADLVFLQEVLGEHERHASRHSNWPQTSHYEFLADSMWDDFAYGRNAVYPDGHHGNALLSKYPIRRFRNLDVSITGPERRGLLHCELEVPGHAQVHAICVHLSLLESHRQLQLTLLCQLLASLPADAPVIIAGDFNDWQLRGNATLTRSTDLHEAFERNHGQLAKTYPARWPLLRLDRIYLRNASSHAPRILSHKPWTHLSDHLPLTTQVRLHKTANTPLTPAPAQASVEASVRPADSESTPPAAAGQAPGNEPGRDSAAPP